MTGGREFVDKDHEAMGEYYDLCEILDRKNKEFVKGKLKKLIGRDPNFLDSYLLFYEIMDGERKTKEAEKILDRAFEIAIKLITDKSGNWPVKLEWGWLENRHIIRTILNKALSFWEKGENEKALNLLRKLLKTNPNDNIGARNYILAIRMGMSFGQFERRFDKGGYYDMDLTDWFDKNSKKFPGEFGWWEKTVEEDE